jgi:hypothetical protein
MLLGMTRGEFALVVFVFGLVYSAALVPRVGAFVGRHVAGLFARRPHSGS